MINKAEVSVESTTEVTELSLWRDKYERLLHHYNALQNVNQELEDKLLKLVEKSEHDKLLLSREIDHLAERLAGASNTADYFRHECGRYKSDCMLAVHLLHCQPSSYAQQKLNALPEDLQKKMSPLLEAGGLGTEKFNERKQHVTLPTQMTFPPMAMFLHNNISTEEEAPPEPTTPDAKSKIPELFVKNILDQPDYQTPKLMQCPKCGVSVTKLDQQTQTTALDLAASAVGFYGMRYNEEDEYDYEENAVVHNKTNTNKRTLSGDSQMSTDTPI